jgi:4-alpha-glucanotransferase
VKFGQIDRFLTGVSVPVSALRSKESCGVGEFSDLPLFGAGCREAGLEVIQILPVNDTGADSSPYSALSAFALHPLYLRLQSVPGASRYIPEIDSFREHAEKSSRFFYAEVLSFKLSLAERIFQDNGKAISADKRLARYRKDNPWVTAYAAFRALKPGTEASPEAVWESEPGTCLFHGWLQYILEGQLTAAARSLWDMGVRLKGDIPILMNPNSADVWSSPRYFDLSLRAGAPPDMYSTEGQNWGFPVYDWDALAKDGYAWWKGRIGQAAKFFHAFRIDHVLGFFRIWSIPRTEKRGLLGRFSPAVPVTRTELSAAGCDDGRIRWLSVPHASARELTERTGTEAPRIQESYFDRVGGEQLFTLKPAFDAEKAILALGEPPEIRDFLLSKHADRALIRLAEDAFLPTWYFWESSSFKTLSGTEQENLRGLFKKNRLASEKVWEDGGRLLLGVLRDASDMLVCAEDLGDVPACVPRVLSDLGILGLRIARWVREYASPGAPFIPPQRYPRLTVCTASVHDTSTLRAWWEESPVEREAYYRHIGLPGACPERMSPEVLRSVFEHLLEADSRLCMFQLQDILDLDEGLWNPDPREDRVNVPGTVNERNWTWRMPIRIEDLKARGLPASRMRELAAPRARRSMS